MERNLDNVSGWLSWEGLSFGATLPRLWREPVEPEVEAVEVAVEPLLAFILAAPPDLRMPPEAPLALAVLEAGFLVPTLWVVDALIDAIVFVSCGCGNEFIMYFIKMLLGHK